MIGRSGRITGARACARTRSDGLYISLRGDSLRFSLRSTTSRRVFVRPVRDLVTGAEYKRGNCGAGAASVMPSHSRGDTATRRPVLPTYLDSSASTRGDDQSPLLSKD